MAMEFSGPFNRQQLVKENNGSIIDIMAQDYEYPLRLAYSSTTGLHLVASRLIRAGDLILREAPISVALESQYNSQYCAVCTQSIDSNQLGAWRSRPTNDPNSVLCEDCSCNNFIVDMNNLLYRLGVRLVADDQEQDSQGASASGQHHATNSSSQVDVGLYRMNFRLMLGYAEAIRNAVDDDVVLLDMRATCMLLADDFAIDPQLSAELDRISTIINQLYTSATANQSSLTAAQISLLCRIMISNQHAISSANGKYDIGRGFYPVTALLNHSCQPNISWQTSAKTRSIMECRALQDIAPGTPLTISYVNPLRLQQQNDNDGCKQRKQFLLGERGFLCACQLCAGRCNQCAKGACTLSCARCRLAWYCSTECQREDWPRHNRWCKQQSTAYHEFQ